MRRRLITVGLLALLGAITTLGVSSMIAMTLRDAALVAPAERAIIGQRQGCVTVWSEVGWSVVYSGPFVAEAWSPWQVSGPPDTPGSGDIRTAWAAKTEDGQVEWLKLRYRKPVVPAAVEIHETYNPGAVCKVSVQNANGAETVVWEGADPTPVGSARGVSRIEFDHDQPVDRIKITLDSPAVAGWNEIDAVALIDRSGNAQWAVDVAASTTFASIGTPTLVETPQEALPSWCPNAVLTDLEEAGAQVLQERLDVATGWPFSSFRRTVEATSDGSPRLIISSFRPNLVLNGPKVTIDGVSDLPLIPVLPGLIADTLLYALLWYALYRLARPIVRLRPFRVVREAARARRGVCPGCGFDLRFELSTGCPECGWRRDS